MSINPRKSNEPTHITLHSQEIVRIFESKSDCEIWAAFNKGDEMAFNYLYRIYAPVLYQYGFQFSKDSSLIQDSIQNIFIYLRSKRGELSEVANIKGYLYRSIQREIIKNLKALTKREQINTSALENSFLIEISPETSFIQNETKSLQITKLQNGIDQLTCKQRKALLLFYQEELSYNEIAQIMDFKEVKTARKLIYRAITSLKEFIKPAK
jgi:RNA polymerase sigma-70 factor (ECF subfamily)